MTLIDQVQIVALVWWVAKAWATAFVGSMVASLMMRNAIRHLSSAAIDLDIIGDSR